MQTPRSWTRTGLWNCKSGKALMVQTPVLQFETSWVSDWQTLGDSLVLGTLNGTFPRCRILGSLGGRWANCQKSIKISSEKTFFIVFRSSRILWGVSCSQTLVNMSFLPENTVLWPLLVLNRAKTGLKLRRFTSIEFNNIVLFYCISFCDYFPLMASDFFFPFRVI